MNILCVGDSHTRYFMMTGYHYRNFGVQAGPKVLALPLTAASAAGFAKGPESRFAYRSVKAQAPTFNYDMLCYNFGQVDAEAGVYYGRYVLCRDETDEDYFTRVYSSYLDQCAAFADTTPFVIKGLNTSCLIDDRAVALQVFGMTTRRIKVQSEREEIQKRLEDADTTVEAHAKRNALANDILKSLAKKKGISFFDIRDAVEDPNMPGLTDTPYLPHNPDIHLVKSYYVIRAHYQGLMTAVLE